jgi:hypothetical protein
VDGHTHVLKVPDHLRNSRTITDDAVDQGCDTHRRRDVTGDFGIDDLTTGGGLMMVHVFLLIEQVAALDSRQIECLFDLTDDRLRPAIVLLI